MNLVRPDPAIAATVTNRMHLRAIHTASIEARIVAVVDMSAPLEWAPIPIEVAWSLEGEEYRAIVLFGAVINQRNGETLATKMVLRTAFRIDYVASPGAQVSVDEAMHYLGVHAVLHGWPCFRADVLNGTARLEIAPLTLPALLSSQVSQLATVRQLTEADTRAPAVSEPSSESLPPIPTSQRASKSRRPAGKPAKSEKSKATKK